MAAACIFLRRGNNQPDRRDAAHVNTALAENLPDGQKYFQGVDITDPCILLVLEHTVPLVRTAATRETFSFVVTF